jgi:ferric-dicitrate binding protein FerR (iron transport regulator)
VVAEIARRFDLKVLIEDDALRTRTVTGRFADQTPAEILAGICRAVDATCSTRDGVVVMKAVSRL